MRRTAATAVVLAGVYALTLASDAPLDLLAGLVIGGALSVLLARRLRAEPRGARPPLPARVLHAPVFAAGVAWDVATGTWDVSLRVLHLRALRHPGIVRVPIGERSDRGVAVTALATTLSPGSVFLGVDPERGDMLLHVMDASDPDAVRAHMQRFYERYQRRVFP